MTPPLVKLQKLSYSGFDLQPDGLTAELAGHCQPDKKYPFSQKEKMICMSAPRETIHILSSNVVKFSKQKAPVPQM